MNSLKQIALGISILFFAMICVGQERDIPFDKRLFVEEREGFDQAVKEIKLGDFYFFDGRDELLPRALKHFLKAQDFNPYSSILNYKIGICYLYGISKPKSLPHLEFAYRVNPELDIDLMFYLAQAYQLCGYFEKAIDFYKRYQKLIPPGDRKQHLYIQKKISESRNAIELVANPVRVWIDNLGDSINTPYSEFSPVISADNKTLYYTARRPDSNGEKQDRSGNYFEDIYYSERNSEEDWSAAKNIGAPVNTESHDATVGVSPDGKSILTYRGISSKNGDILITKQLPDGTWEIPQSVGDRINTKHHESSASLSFDEKTLFFVSDRPGGYGQHDIYMSNWNEETEEWDEAQNLGSTINTRFEEMGVFFHADSKTLYFSSDGHENMGGLDVFKSSYNEQTGEWSEPENIGHPINTPDDDIYFVVTGNGRYAYYSSSRPGGFGEKDIYKITFLGPRKKPAVISPELINEPEVLQTYTCPELTTFTPTFLLTGKLKNGKNGQGIQGQIYVINARTNQNIEVVNTHPDGSYSIALLPGESYALTAAGKHFTISSKILNSTSSDANQMVEMDFELFAANANTTAGNTFVLRNIYFEFGKADLDYGAFGSQAQLELDLLANFLIDNPTITIELSGHTDRRGSADYNMKLSQKRAEIAKQYLVDKGIDSNRIIAKGYGETVPEIPWSEIKSLKNRKDREEAHQRNRRTVVTILSK